MKGSYNILSNNNLLVEILKKTISANEYTKLKIDEFQDKRFNRSFNLITDLSDFDKNIDKNKIKDLFIVFKENKGKFIRNKSALVVSNKEMQNAINSIIKEDKKIYKEIKTFTSIENAKQWML